MIGVDIKDATESISVQESITKIVNDKKTGTQSPDIKYLPTSMISNLKISSKKTFRLMRSIVEEYFNIDLGRLDEPIPKDALGLNDSQNSDLLAPREVDSDLIVDYRSKFFEEQDKNSELEKQLAELKAKLDNIKQIIE